MHVTVSFDEWKLTERDIRSYVSSVLGALRPHWERLWQEAGESTSHPDVDQVDVFYDRAGGIMPNDTEWMVLTGAFKDAVRRCRGGTVSRSLRPGRGNAGRFVRPGKSRARGFPAHGVAPQGSPGLEGTQGVLHELRT